MTVTKQNARKVAKALTANVNALILTRAVAEVERKRVDAITAQVLAEDVYMAEDHDGKEYRITEPSKAWHMNDADAERFYGKLNAIHLAAGFAKAADGFCPALVAENLQLEAEWALISAAEEFFPGVTNNQLLCGTEKKGGLEFRQEYIDLLCGLVVNAPGYRKPKI